MDSFETPGWISFLLAMCDASHKEYLFVQAVSVMSYFKSKTEWIIIAPLHMIEN